MTTPDRTQDLIAGLAREAGGGPRRRHGSAGTMVATAVLTFAAAAILARLALPAPHPLLATLVYRPFDDKLIAMTVLAVGGLAAVWQAGHPGTSSRLWLWLLPGVALLAAGAVFDSSGFPPLGRDSFAVPSCAVSILVLSCLPLAFLFRLLSRAIVTNPARAGGAAGLLAGAIGGGAYAFVCRNDGGLFVALWYGAAILATAAIGAGLGARALRW